MSLTGACASLIGVTIQVMTATQPWTTLGLTGGLGTYAWDTTGLAPGIYDLRAENAGTTEAATWVNLS